ncbi:helix-turn-helix domain-containing protein [Heyndrickxia sp. NPDC080065]|uniref:helix-turn-helix domain-containing protein n=1 Tax=Heyndrickxia sp. NPDC080065 TaxID=3390568 RepID=UPI003D07565B
MSIHERFKKIREELNMTQEELGARMGRQQPEISKLETGKQVIASDVIDDFIKATNLSNEHLIYLIRGSESGNVLQPMIIREHFADAEMQRTIEFFELEPALTKEINILSYYPEKQKRKLINNIISLIKNERE